MDVLLKASIWSSLICLHNFWWFVLLLKLIEITSFAYTFKVNLFCLRSNIERLVIISKGFLKLPELLMLINQGRLLTLRNFVLVTFTELLIVFSTNFNQLFPLYWMVLRWLLLHLLKSFLKTDSDNFIHDYPFRSNLKLCNIPVTSDMFQKLKMNLDSSKVLGPNCILVVDPELLYVLSYLFNMIVFEGILFFRLFESLICGPIVSEVWAKYFHPVNVLSNSLNLSIYL